MATIIAVLNQKGGSGKSTVSFQLGGNFSRQGYEVLLCDCDPQGSVSRGSSVAPDDKPYPAKVVRINPLDGVIHKEVENYFDDYDLIIIDCPPVVESTLPRSAIAIADLVIIPTQPAPYDLWAVADVHSLIEKIETQRGQPISARILINRKKTGTKLAKVIESIIEDLPIRRFTSVLYDRTAYETACGLGVLVHDLGSRAKEAINEMDQLTMEIAILLSNLSRSDKGVEAVSQG